uniref:RING-type E3 ubiquitin transferase n=1 Tax=Leersia perrieri TaxID=77586 RepID=A0A0D9V441_9ORYZ
MATLAKNRMLCFVLLVLSTTATTLSTAAPSGPYSSRCGTSPTPAADQHTDVDDAAALIRSFQITSGFFSGGGADTLFSAGSYVSDGFARPSFSLLPHSVSRTTDPTVLHLAATLTMSGIRVHENYDGFFGNSFRKYSHSISFYLDGYYSSASAQLCMVGEGSELSNEGSVTHYAGVALRLRIPSPSSLTDPFVTGNLEGADFEPISLVTYAEGTSYEYSATASCPPVSDSDSVPRRAIETSPDGGNFSDIFLPEETAIVADGRWDSVTNRLCLRACLVARSSSPPSSTNLLEVRECGIGMSFWFPAVWTIRDRSVAAGALWNATQLNSSASSSDALITASSFEKFKGNVSDVNYSYNFTMLDEAKKNYLKVKARLNTSNKKKSKGSFARNHTNYSRRDFDFMFFLDGGGSGRAYPVSIDSAMVEGNSLSAEDSFSGHAARQLKQSSLVNVSYGVLYSVMPKNLTDFVRTKDRHIWAEGVYDPTTGYLSLVGCGELNDTMDCRILITVQFTPSSDGEGFSHGKGRISSLRDSRDSLYFPRRDIALLGMYSHEVSDSIWTMDTESVVVVISTTLTCVFTVLQILHTKRNPKAAASTSITMLAVQALGLVTPLVVNYELLIMNKRKYMDWLIGDADGWLHLNELMLRVPTLIAFALQLRLLQLGMARPKRHIAGRREEAAVTVVVHMVNVRAAREAALVSRRFAPAEAATLWADLASYVGLVLDGFLLPQVVFNAASGSRVEAISPWFYAGGTVIRAAPHAYDALRAMGVSYGPSHVYASARDDFFGAAWDVVVPLGAASLALVLFLQQRLGGDLMLRSRSRRSRDYQLVSAFQR